MIKLGIGILAIGIGGALGINALIAPNGYVAAYSFGAVWVLSVLILGVGLVICLFPKCRKFGLWVLVLAFGILLSFYIIYLVGISLNLHVWKDNKDLILVPLKDPAVK